MRCTPPPEVWPWAAMIAALSVLYLVVLVRAVRKPPAGDDMRTADKARIDRESRHLALQPPRASAPHPLPAAASARPRVLDIVPTAERRITIANEAHAAACHDFQTVGRRRANPYAMHTRLFACWALEYASKWEHLVTTHGEPIVRRPKAVPPAPEGGAA